MKNRWIALALMLVLALAALLPAAAAAESSATPVAVTLKLGVKEKYQIDLSSVSALEGKALVFKSSNKKVATVSSTGVITAKKKGTAKIGVGYEGNSAALVVCTVKVQKAPGKVTLSDKKAVISVGDTRQLKAKLPSKTASTITYTSSNPDVATVDAEGNVKGVSGGKTTITARTFNKKSAKCTVYVLTGPAPANMTLNVPAVSLQVKDTFKLTPSIDEGSDAIYSFSTKNKKIATVSSEGLITGKKKGKTTVTVKTHNGLSQSVTVTVRSKLKEVYGYLTNSTDTYLKNVQALKLTRDATSDDATSVQYYDSQLALIMTANSCRISLNTATSPKYSLEGIDVSMPAQQAAVKLVSGGWTLADTRTVDGVQIRSFIKGADNTHTLAISSDDGTTIRAIEATMAW